MFINKFTKILKYYDKPYLIFWSSLIFYFFLLLFNYNNKTLFLLFFLFFIFVWWLLKDFILSLFLTFFSSLIIITGKYYFFELIPLSQLDPVENIYSYRVTYFISPSLIFSLGFGYFFIRFLPKIIRLIKRKIYLTIFIIINLLQIIPLYYSKNISLSFLLLLSYLLPSLIFILTYVFKKTRTKMFSYLLMILSAQLVFESIIVCLQFLKRGSLGTSIEANQEIYAFGKGTDEDAFIFRPNGTFAHPNSVAAFITPILTLFYSLLYTSFKKIDRYKKIIFVSFIFGFISLIITLSRSAWLSFYIGIVFLSFFFIKKWNLKTFLIKFNKNNLIFILVAAILFFIFIFPRLKQTVSTFAIGGSLYTRNILIEESLRLIFQNPFGVGMGMSVAEIFYGSGGKSITYGFPTPVHNWYLLTASEMGLFYLLGFLILFLILVRKILYQKKDFQSKDEKIVFIGLATTILVMLINGLMQPFLGNQALLYYSLAYLFAKIDNL